MNFCRFFAKFSVLVLKNDEVTKFRTVFAKRLSTALKKFLDNRSKRFANTTQTFFNKRGFQKLEKNLNKFICIRTKIRTIWIKKELRYRFFCWRIFFSLLCYYNNFWEILYVKSIFSASSEWLIFFRFILITKYTKYSLNLTFGWECNDTPSSTSQNISNVCNVLFIFLVIELTVLRSL